MRRKGRSRWVSLLSLAAMAALPLAGLSGARAGDEPTAAENPPTPTPPPTASSTTLPATPPFIRPVDKGKFKDFNEVTKDAEKIEGLFTLHKTGDHLYAEILPNQFNQPLLTPVMIARGMANTGMPVGNDEAVLVFKRVGDRVQVISRNIHHKAPAGTPLEKAVRQNYVDSILMALPIIAINPMRGAVLIDLSDIFMTDFAQLGLGSIDRNRSTWTKVKGFPNNMELEMETTFSASGRRGSDSGVPDSRGLTVVIHYSIVKTPDAGYRPRVADERVGYFLNAHKDFGGNNPDTNLVRYINRWRLEKADPKAKLSSPKKQIVWYVEDNVPLEYRPYVEEGILEWNKAFEKIGYRNVIAVRWAEPGRDDFDPEDINYCTFRWVTTDAGFARSCFRANPLTGEMIDGDVIFDSSFIRAWQNEYALLVGSTTTAEGEDEVTPLAYGEIISPILASKMGYGSPAGMPSNALGALNRTPGQMIPELIPADQGMLQWQLAKNLSRFGDLATCQRRSGLSQDFGLAAMVLAGPDSPAAPAPAANADKDKKDEDKNKDKDKKDEDKDKKKPEPKHQLPEEFLGQALKEVVMHEVGHSLGLRHNFKASTMLTADQLNDTSITREKGLTGSVMDYNPVNIAPKGTKQGDYYSTTLGPYDYWAIEYGYKQIDGNEEAELKKIASRAPEPDLAYATDEDVVLNNDPYVNRWDLGSDPREFSKNRIALASELLKDLDDRVVRDGESWTRMRRAFSILLNQWGNAATLSSQYIAGQSISRDYKADKDGRDPIEPISGETQRENLQFLVENILTDKPFEFSPAVLRRLGNERWMHWNAPVRRNADITVFERILGIQKIVLGQCLSGSTLSRLQNQQLQADHGTSPLRIDEVFRALTDGIWADLDKLPTNDDKDSKAGLSVIRRNLQREHLRRLGEMAIGSGGGSLSDDFGFVILIGGGNASVPADARALARLHLREIRDQIAKQLDAKGGKLDDTTRAHLEESKEKITRILDAQVNVRDL